MPQLAVMRYLLQKARKRHLFFEKKPEFFVEDLVVEDLVVVFLPDFLAS